MDSRLFLLIATLSSAFAFENKTIGEFCEKRIQKPVFNRRAELEDYLKTKNGSGELQKEFESIGNGQLFVADESVSDENKAKNRNEKYVAYDHSRVQLNVSKPQSDYINANNLDGVDQPNRYIVTQLPMQNTVNDFWQMVWDNNVYILVLITKLNGNGNERLFKYWPEDAARFGKIEVILDKSDFLTDYVVRTFTISNENKKRHIKQYHLLDWSDDNLPTVDTMFRFVNTLREQRDYKPSKPLVVHCSLGSGPSGTVVLIDSALQAYRKFYKMDFSRHLCWMRMKRMNVVESYSQFELAIKVVVTSINKMRAEAKP